VISARPGSVVLSINVELAAKPLLTLIASARLKNESNKKYRIGFM